MTVSELYESVAQLGFETALEDNGRFFYAANRAILQVTAIRPTVAVFRIYHKPLPNVLGETFSPIDKEDDLTFEGNNVRSYYFEADGKGIAYVEVYDGSANAWVMVSAVEFSAERSFSAFRGFIRRDGSFISGRVRLRFLGEYFYSVRNVALYRQIYSDRVEDIPAFECYTRYDIGALVPDFLALYTSPIMVEGDHTRLNRNYEVENDRVILLPHDAKGVYQIPYKRRPAELAYTDDPVEDGTVIDLDEELCALLPMLVAAYVWADDEPEKAEYYMTLYRERAADIERRHRNTAPVKIKSVNDW